MTASSMLDDDALDHVGRVLARVDRALGNVVDVLPFDDLDRVIAVLEQLGHGLAYDPVTLVLKPMDLDPVLLEALEIAQLGESPGDLLALANDDLGLLQRDRRRLVDPV